MIKPRNKTLIGNKVILEPFSLKFVSKDYLEWMNNKSTTKYIEKAKKNNSLDDINCFVNEMIKSNKDYFFAILLKKNLYHIGNVRLGPIDFKLLKSNFGILIGNMDHRGSGIGTEVMKLIKDFSFKHIKLKQINFPVVEKHIAAMRLYKKTGFTLKKETNKTLIKDGKSLQLVEWSMNNPYITKQF